jgi:hypothetical protein
MRNRLNSAKKQQKTSASQNPCRTDPDMIGYRFGADGET